MSGMVPFSIHQAFILLFFDHSEHTSKRHVDIVNHVFCEDPTILAMYDGGFLPETVNQRAPNETITRVVRNLFEMPRSVVDWESARHSLTTCRIIPDRYCP
jgi:hypothetical protein